MGNAPGKLNSSTSNSNATACDGGSLVPNGIYPEDAQDFDAKVVQRLILVRQMAPFYAGADDPDPEVASTNTKANLTLEDNNADANDNADADGDDAAVAIAAAVVVGSADQTKKNDDGWWSYNMMLAQHEQQQKQSMEEYENSAHSLGASTSSLAEGSAASPGRRSGHARVGSGFFQRLKNSHQRSPSSAAAAANSDPQSPLAFPKHSSPSLSPAPTHQHLHNHDRSFSDQQQQPPVDLQKLLRRHVECPICFLYYPQNINYTRCCHKPLCTECFVQIKRKLDDDLITPTHCPYCVEVNLGIIYYAPVGVRGLMTASLAGGGFVDDSRGRAHSFSGGRNANNNTGEPLIVMSDDIRPGLVKELGAEIEAKRREQERSAENMALVAAATRRASARTARAGRSQGAAAGSGSGSSSRQRRLVAVAPEYAAYASAMRAAGQTDLEEFLIQEAIRMSLAAQEGEQQQRNVTAADPLEPLAEQPEESAAAPTAGLGDAIDAIDPAEPIANQADPAEPIADTNQPISAPALAPLTLDAAELEAIASITSRCDNTVVACE
ncbi:SNF1-interacting protein [Kickxella alabastrina]|uniref:SNF1-interacting protein n=1 Tax=Kickxella alabastrina TaxID=61397 RepID=A0ACC1INE3_9FUNG|nr:SNF1-interacting protein [Kickxella alabastrina]